jgi:3,4-dihydroxy-2-butanone 4-phosphate synthase
VSVRVGSGESADEASTSVDGTANRNLASMLPEQSEAEEYAVSVTVDGRRRASTTVQAETRAVTVRIDVIGTVDVERAGYGD